MPECCPVVPVAVLLGARANPNPKPKPHPNLNPCQCCWEPEMYELWGGGAPFTQEGTAPNNTLRDARDTKARSARYTGPLTY